MNAIRVDRLGWKAAAALAASGHVARVVAPLARSIYLTAGEEIVWLGGADATLHGRAMLLPAPTVEAETLAAEPFAMLRFDVAGARGWRPAPAPPVDPATLRAGCRRLLAALAEVGEPRGLGALIAGGTPAFPLDRARDAACAFAAACANDDADAAFVTATALIGLGPGLTPAGDDFVGGGLFARAVSGRQDAAWRAAGDAIVGRARSCTHPVSAVLLADLRDGAAHEPLHELVTALATGATPAAMDAARRLTRIGHSSGWDLLAGFVGALTGLPSADR